MDELSTKLIMDSIEEVKNDVESLNNIVLIGPDGSPPLLAEVLIIKKDFELAKRKIETLERSNLEIEKEKLKGRHQITILLFVNILAWASAVTGVDWSWLRSLIKG